MFEANAWLYKPLSAHLSCSLCPCLHVQACLQKTPDASYSRAFSYAHKAYAALQPGSSPPVAARFHRGVLLQLEYTHILTNERQK